MTLDPHQSKVMNVIDSNRLERDAGGKAVLLFLIPLYASAPWQCLSFLPEPQGQGWLRPTLP